MSDDFQRAVLRELDQIRAAFERAVTQIEHRAEERDSEVSELKLNVGLLREECRRNMKRDAALVSAPTVLVTAVVAIAQHLTGVPQASAPSQPAARCGDAIVQASEQCDDGVNDGRPGRCLPGCQGWGRVTP